MKETRKKYDMLTDSPGKALLFFVLPFAVRRSRPGVVLIFGPASDAVFAAVSGRCAVYNY